MCPDRADLAPDTTFGDYRIERVLGRGGMSVVYLAEHQGLKRRVALKVLSPQLAEDPRFRERFVRESQVAASIDHPNVIPIYEAGEAEGQLFIAMRYVEGTDLRALLHEEGRLEEGHAVGILLQVAGALDAAHARGLVHRDVKPGNILVARAEGSTAGEHVYLSDFGLTKRAASDSGVTGTGQFVGTLDYASPEQFEGKTLEPRADVYSLGCVLYECLAGHPPFRRESDAAVMYAHLLEDPPPLTGQRPGLPEEIDRVIERATAKKPEQRFESAGELGTAARVALGYETGERAAPARVRGRRRGRRRRRRSRWLVSAIAALLVVALVATGIAIIRKGGSDSFTFAANRVGVLDAETGAPVGQTSEQILDVRSGDGAIWGFQPASNSIVRIDPSTLETGKAIALGVSSNDYAVGDGSLWVTDQYSPTLIRIDPTYGTVVGRISLARSKDDTLGSDGLLLAEGSVWVARWAAGEVVRIDPATDEIVHRFDVSAAHALAFGDGAIWVAQSAIGSITKIDPATNTIMKDATVKLHPWICCLVAGGGTVWATLDADGVVWKIDSSGRVQKSIETGANPGSLAIGPDSVWVANYGSGTISRIDPVSDAVTTIDVGHSPGGLVVEQGRVFFGTGESESDLTASLTGDILHVIQREDFLDDLDPATAQNTYWGWQMFYATCAKLVNYPDAPAPEGWNLAPEIAAAPPSVSADGRTYSFAIAPGFRFSPPSNQPVTAETMRSTIERALSPDLVGKFGNITPAYDYMRDIVGVQDYYEGRADHISGLSATGDTLTIRLTAPAPDLLARLAMPYFCAVPDGTPPSTNFAPIPSAGPYYVSDKIGGLVTVLKRNPNYTGSRPHAFDAIVVSAGINTGQAVTRIEQGTADYDVEYDPALKPGGAVDVRYGASSQAASEGNQRYFLQPLAATDLIAFNPNSAVLSDPRMRQAVNYALDRPALAAVWDEAPADRYLPPVMPGVQGPSIYPVDGPDLARATSLANGQGGTVVLYAYPGDQAKAIADIISRDLARIGLDVQARFFKDPVKAAGAPGADADMLLTFRYQVFLDSPDFLTQGPASDSYPEGWAFDGPELSAQLQSLAGLTDPERQVRAAELEADLMRTVAPVAPFAVSVVPQLFSERIGCKVFQPAYFGVDLAALCLA